MAKSILNFGLALFIALGGIANRTRGAGWRRSTRRALDVRGR